MIYINILLITTIICLVTDISGVVESIKNWLKKWLDIKGEVKCKLLECSLCQSHWINLIYVIYLYINDCLCCNFLFIYTYILFLSVNTTNITNILLFIRDLIENIIQKLWKKLN